VTALVVSAAVEVVAEAEAYDAVLVVAGSDWPQRLKSFRDRYGVCEQQMLLLAQPGDLHLDQAAASGFRVFLGWDDRACLEPALQAASNGIAYRSVSLLTTALVVPERDALTSDLRGRLRQLSQREREVLRLVLRGLTNEQIASSLCVALVTVKVHLGQIFRKCGVERRAELLALLMVLGDTLW
jgi:DNA-binding NarL/FixJ family response regulator